MLTLNKMNQTKLFILLSILILFSFFSNAQQSNCALKLDEAENLYEMGDLDSISAMLRSCIKDGFEDAELSRAYKLLIRTYLFEDYQEMAELTMMKFLKKFPEYEIKANDPVEFTYLYNSYQTIPLYSIGFIGGINYSFVRIITPYSIFPEEYSPEYSVSEALSYQVGVQLKRYINENIELNLDVIYTLKGFHYELKQDDFLTRYDEKQTIISFPVSGVYDFKLGTWSPYLRVGFNVDYMFNASADFHKEYDLTGIETEKEIDYYILPDRNPLNISALIGGGVKYNIKSGYFMLDLRYHLGFMNNTNADNRYDNVKLNYGYIDDDFALSNFFVSVGYVRSFYRTKQNK